MQGFYVLSRFFGYLRFQGPDLKRFGRKRLWLSGIIVFVAVISSGFLLPGRSIAADRQEAMEQRTENTKTFKNSDGTTTIEFSTEPLHYLDDAGTWQDIDTSITASNTSSSSDTMNTMAVDPASYPQYSVTKNAYKAYFGAALAEPIRMEWKDKSVEFYPFNYATPSVSVVKNSITYVDAWKDADLRYIVTPRQLKEEIILKTAAVAATYSFLVKTIGVNLVKETDGSISMYDVEKGDKLWSLPAPYAMDSSAIPQVSNAAVKMALRQEGKDQYIDLSVDPSWLNDPGRVFPVTIDPTVTNNIYGESYFKIFVPYPQTVYWGISFTPINSEPIIRDPGGDIGDPGSGIGDPGWGDQPPDSPARFRILQNGQAVVSKESYTDQRLPANFSGNFWGHGNYTVIASDGTSVAVSGSITYNTPWITRYVSGDNTISVSIPYPQTVYWSCYLGYTDAWWAIKDSPAAFYISQNGQLIVERHTWSGNLSDSGGFPGQGDYTIKTQTGYWKWSSGSASGSVTFRVNNYPSFNPIGPEPKYFYNIKTPTLTWEF